jgi:predicted subunit of tRNA(5-methylaminomethyl-2-thiouridylate) methyltransferase
MKAGVLYSGGKDSSLMAVILQRMGLEVELITANFGVYDSWIPASKSASALGFKHRVLKLDKEILKTAVDKILADGFPNRGIDHIHHNVIEKVAEDYSLVADGTRRDDRIPKLKENQIRSFEDRNQVEYVNLQGFGHKTIERFSSTLFEVTREESNRKNNSDYEVEVRCLIDELNSEGKSASIFPQHFQTRVTGWSPKLSFREL